MSCYTFVKVISEFVLNQVNKTKKSLLVIRVYY